MQLFLSPSCLASVKIIINISLLAHRPSIKDDRYLVHDNHPTFNNFNEASREQRAREESV